MIEMEKKDILELIDLEKANWGGVKQANYDVVVLPWGAIEPHNYHLPYTTDCHLARNVALDAALLAWEKHKVLAAVMPAIFLGSQNPGQWSLPLCIHTSSETQKSILSDIVSSLHGQGFRKLLIVNGHGGNSFKSYIRDFAKLYPDFTVAVTDWWSFLPHAQFFESDIDEHAGELETSVMMHYRPDLVDLEKAGSGSIKENKLKSLNDKTVWIPRNWTEITDDTGVGNPKQATASKGFNFAQAVSEKLAFLLKELRDNL